MMWRGVARAGAEAAGDGVVEDLARAMDAEVCEEGERGEQRWGWGKCAGDLRARNRSPQRNVMTPRGLLLR